MKRHYAYRGAKVLYDFLVSNQVTGTFLLPANVCESLPQTFQEAGINVRFLDIQPDTLCINQQQVLSLISNYTGVLLVHTYGIERDFDFFYEEVREKNPEAIIIDDRCLCMPDFEVEGRYSAAEADLTLFSMGDKKQVQMGEGGVGVLKDKWKCAHVHVLENSYFENHDYSFCEERYLEQKQTARLHVLNLQEIYIHNLPVSIQLPIEYNNWRFNIRVQQDVKQRIIATLFDNGLFVSSHYRSLAENAQQTTPCIVQLQENVLNLFQDPKFYTEEQAITTCQIINGILVETCS